MSKFKEDPTDPVASAAGWTRRQRRAKHMQDLEDKNATLRARVKLLEQPRREVRFFAAEMERKLRDNDFRSGWKECELEWLFGRLREEVDELHDAVTNHLRDCRANYRSVSEGPMFPPDVAGEAADVANFAMMIADVCGTLNGEDRFEDDDG